MTATCPPHYDIQVSPIVKEVRDETDTVISGRAKGKRCSIRRTWTLWQCRKCRRTVWLPVEPKNEEIAWQNLNLKEPMWQR